MSLPTSSELHPTVVAAAPETPTILRKSRRLTAGRGVWSIIGSDVRVLIAFRWVPRSRFLVPRGHYRRGKPVPRRVASLNWELGTWNSSVVTIRAVVAGVAPCGCLAGGLRRCGDLAGRGNGGARGRR